MKNIIACKSRTFIFYCCLLAVAIVSCKKVNDLLTFSIDNESAITLSSLSTINLPISVLTPDVVTNSSQQFQNNNSNANLVKDIRLKSILLTITNPPGQTFSFLKSIHIYISANGSNEIELASQDNISSTSSTLNLVPTQAKLDEYVKASSYQLRSVIVTKETLQHDTDIKIDSKFDVTANL